MKRLARMAVAGVGFLAACGGGNAGNPIADSGGHREAFVRGRTPEGGLVCPAQALLTSLGRDHFLVGMQADPCTSDLTIFETSGVPYDIRYLYLANGVGSGGPCASCQSNCTVLDTKGPQPASWWWGCWQDTTQPPGLYVQGLVTEAEAHNAIPMVSYYQIKQSGSAAEGPSEVAQLGTDANLTRSVLLDFAFMLDNIHKVATGPVLVQFEPDFWAYAEMLNPDPTQTPVALSGADPADCSGLPNNMAGFGQCVIAIARNHAPEVRLAFHLSSWANSYDADANTDPSHDVKADADADAAFLLACGAAATDFFTLDTDDHDGAYNNDIWDATNTTLPDFTQALTFAGEAATKLKLPAMWWQTPYGNANSPGTGPSDCAACNPGANACTCADPSTNLGYKDNRVDYFFAHPAEFAAAHGFAIAFGAGNACQTDAYSDGGNFVSKSRAYFSGGPITNVCM
jgi:hypothetical protein